MLIFYLKYWRFSFYFWWSILVSFAFYCFLIKIKFSLLSFRYIIHCMINNTMLWNVIYTLVVNEDFRFTDFSFVSLTSSWNILYFVYKLFSKWFKHFFSFSYLTSLSYLLFLINFHFFYFKDKQNYYFT